MNIYIISRKSFGTTGTWVPFSGIKSLFGLIFFYGYNFCALGVMLLKTLHPLHDLQNLVAKVDRLLTDGVDL